MSKGGPCRITPLAVFPYPGLPVSQIIYCLPRPFQHGIPLSFCPIITNSLAFIFME